MKASRSLAPTIVGIFNIPMGILGGLGAWLYMGEATSPGAISSDSRAVMIKGLIALVGFAAAAVGGIGLIRRSAWGRLSTIAGGTLITTYMIFRSMLGEMTPFTWGLVCYAIVLTLAMFLPAWKAQFRASGDAGRVNIPDDLQQFRRAA